jgi:hypothetical protein
MNPKKIFLMINIFAPLSLAAIVYYVISPDVIFVAWLDSLLGRGVHLDNIRFGTEAVRFIRNYVLDMMWGYALVFALYFIMGNNAAGLTKLIIIASVFSTVMELLQLTPFVRGTFDVLDIIVEILAEATAVFIIKKHFMEEFHNEKEN